jgi:hypothetical protein
LKEKKLEPHFYYTDKMQYKLNATTPSNYTDLMQGRLVADMFKTPDQRLQDESSGEVQFNIETRKPFEGAEDETVQLTTFDSPKSVRRLAE